MIRVITAFALLLTLLAGCDSGRQPVDIRLPTLDAERFSLSANQGKVVVLTFWATFCTVCKTQLVDMPGLADTAGPDKLTLATVCSDAENLNQVKAIVSRLGVTLPVLLDEHATVFRRLELSAFPTTLVYGPDGHLVMTRVGYDKGVLRDLRATITRLTADGGS